MSNLSHNHPVPPIYRQALNSELDGAEKQFVNFLARYPEHYHVFLSNWCPPNTPNPCLFIGMHKTDKWLSALPIHTLMYKKPKYELSLYNHPGHSITDWKDVTEEFWSLLDKKGIKMIIQNPDIIFTEKAY